MVPRGQPAVGGCQRVSDDLLDDYVPQRRVLPPHDAEAQVLLRLPSEQLHHDGLGHQAGPQGGVVWREEARNKHSCSLRVRGADGRAASDLVGRLHRASGATFAP